MKKSNRMDRRVATNALAQLYAKYFANDEDDENNLKVESLENLIRQQYPREYKSIEAAATNLSLGSREHAT